MAGTITIKGGIHSVIQNDENDNLIVTTNDASKQIYFQGTSSGDAPMFIDQHGNTVFQDTGSKASVSLAVSQSEYGGFQVIFKSGSNWRGNAIRFLQDVSGSGYNGNRALITLSGSTYMHAGINMMAESASTKWGSFTRMERAHGGMYVSNNPMGLAVHHMGMHPYSHSFCIGSGLSWGIAWGSPSVASYFEVQLGGANGSGYNIYRDPRIHHRIETSMTSVTMSGNLDVAGVVSATRKSFVIDHQKMKNHQLVHGSLEGPENGVYIRGKIENDNKVALPDYWDWLVDDDSISVHITPIGYHILPLYFKEIKDNYVYVNKKTNFYYYICAERKDVEKLKIIEKK